MFVRNRENIDFKYRKRGKCVVLKANTVTFIEDTFATPEELRSCYGQRIEVISKDFEDKAVNSVNKNEIKKVVEVQQDNVIDNLLAEVEKELKEEEDKKQIKEVKDFLEGNTDKLPEGTKEIEEDEANRLLVQAGLGDEINTVVTSINDLNKEKEDEVNSLSVKAEIEEMFKLEDSNKGDEENKDEGNKLLNENKEVKKVVQKKVQTKAGKGRGRKAKNK